MSGEVPSRGTEHYDRLTCTVTGRLPGNHSDRSGTVFLGIEARNNTRQTQRRTMSLKRNWGVKLHGIGSLERLHFTTSGVEKKNDQVIAKVPIPNREPSADSIGLNAPAASNAAVVSSITPSRSASPLTPKI